MIRIYREGVLFSGKLKSIGDMLIPEIKASSVLFTKRCCPLSKDSLDPSSLWR